MSLRSVSHLSLLLVLALTGGCQVNAAVDSSATVHGQATVGARVECAGECRVAYFDGSGLVRLAVGADGAVSVPAPPSRGVFPLFVSATGNIPQVRLVTAGAPLGVVRLDPVPDPMVGHVAVAAVNVVAGEGRAVRLVPAAGAEVVTVLGRARSAVATGPEGTAIITLPANSYGLLVGGQSQRVVVPQGGTVALPVVVGKKLND